MTPFLQILLPFVTCCFLYSLPVNHIHIVIDNTCAGQEAKEELVMRNELHMVRDVSTPRGRSASGD